MPITHTPLAGHALPSQSVSKSLRSAGFTLIELSIVLVIIGLIVGGVLVGQDLIRAAYLRAQLSQIEKFNTAVNTFYGKFGALPGDMNYQTAQNFGFSATVHNVTGPSLGLGDGNGEIVGSAGQLTTTFSGFNTQIGVVTSDGETGVFWVDLSSSTAGNLIEGGFTGAAENGGQPTISGTRLASYLPPAKLGGGNYVFVTSINGINYYGIEVIDSVNSGMTTHTGITVAQAYNMDKKIDDGFPTTGNVVALSQGTSLFWPSGGSGFLETHTTVGSIFSGVVATTGLADGLLTCFGANVAGSNPAYSLSINHGAGLNCAMEFKMQGGD